jgi:hypothetical protein
MGGCFGEGDGIPTLELDVGFGQTSREEEGDRVQMSVQEKGSSIRKMGRKVQDSPNTKGLFIEKRD